MKAVYSQWLAGEDRQATLATFGSTMSSKMPMLYRCLRCGDLRLPGVTERHKGPLRLREDDDVMQTTDILFKILKLPITGCFSMAFS